MPMEAGVAVALAVELVQPVFDEGTGGAAHDEGEAAELGLGGEPGNERGEVVAGNVDGDTHGVKWSTPEASKVPRPVSAMAERSQPMNVLQSIADARDDRAERETEADDRWLRERAGIDPEERRRSFTHWVKGLLAKSLPLPADRARREKMLGQCTAEITVMCRQLRGRGWLLDGAALAAEVKACLDPITAYLRRGNVDDPFAYFRSSVRRYVGAHAEGIQALARRSGRDEATTSMAAALSAFGLGGAARPRETSMVEIVAAHQPATAAKPAKRGPPKKAPCTDDTMPLL